MNLIEELEYVLAEEQRLLLAGDYSQLETFSDRKLLLSDKLTVAGGVPQVSAGKMRRLTQAADRNEALLESAKRGIQAAMSLLRESADDSFQAYSKDGARRPLSRIPSIKHRV